MTRRSRRLLLACAVLSLTGLTAVASPAGAVGLPSPATVNLTAVDTLGYVTHVGDGDTLDVLVDGRLQRIRMTGINAMELTRYSSDPTRWRGECHAVEAARALYDLTFRQTVRIVAQDSASMSGPRLRRTIFVLRDGTWKDVSELLLAQGHGLFLANPTEFAPNQRDAVAAQFAAVKRRGVFDTDRCGPGPYPGAALHVAVRADAPGNDSENPNGEHVRITNGSSYALPLGGWWLRDSSYRGELARGYVFPPGTRVPARGAITVHVGKGRSTATRLFIGSATPMFDNPTGAPTHVGDGAYLFDPQGDLRTWHQYPCRYRC